MTLLEHNQKYEKPKELQAQHANVDVLCLGKTNLFFSERTKDMRIAQQICAACPNQKKCLSEARANPPYAGVWGGVIFVDGEELLFKRGRGRPPKDECSENESNVAALKVLQIA
jgi:WhiB family redox-sensing transcriptional regulator